MPGSVIETDVLLGESKLKRPLTAIAVSICCLAIVAGCGVVTRPEIIGSAAKITTDYIPCAGTIESADNMDTISFAAAVRAMGQGAAVAANSHQLRASHGIWLQKGWMIQFTGAQDLGGLNYTSVSVEQVGESQGSYRGATCWLKTDYISTMADSGQIEMRSADNTSKGSGTGSAVSVGQSRAPAPIRGLPTEGDTRLLPPLGMSRDAVSTRMASVQRSDTGATKGFDIFVMRAGDGSIAYVHIGYAIDHSGTQRVEKVEVNAGPDSNATLSDSWRSAFEGRYQYTSKNIPLSALSNRVRYDGQKQSVTETIGFHSAPVLASIDNTWHSDVGTWKRGPCPSAGPTLIMFYSDDLRRDREIYSELMETCYAAVY